MRYNTILIVCLILFMGVSSKAQESHEHSDHHTPKNEVSLLLSHAHVSQGLVEGKTKWLALPSWQLNYNRILSHHWMLGVHMDIIIEDFVVSSENHEEEGGLERSYPLAIALCGTYKPNHHLGFLLGFGGELEESESFYLLRAGVEGSLPIKNHFELVANILYDFKIDAYNTWSLGVGVAKQF